MSVQNVSIDAERDVVNHLKKILTSEGFRDANSLTDDDTFILYFNYYERVVPARRYQIIKSNAFTCPQNLERGLQSLESKLLLGDSIKAHLSTKILEIEYFDYLLSDWGIYHLQLGTQPHPRIPGFVERTVPLLFVRFIDDTAYFIDVMQHGQWTCRDCVEIIHKNWAQTINNSKLNSAIDIYLNPTDDEIAQYRRANINYFIKLNDNSIYAPIGMGYTTQGNSLKSTFKTIRLRKSIKSLQERVRVHAKEQTLEMLPNFDGDITIEFYFDANLYHIIAGPDTIIVRMLGIWESLFV